MLPLTLLQTRLHIFQKKTKNKYRHRPGSLRKKTKNYPGIQASRCRQSRKQNLDLSLPTQNLKEICRNFKGVLMLLRKVHPTSEKNEKLPRNPGPTLPPDSKAKSRSFVSKSNGLSTRYSQPVTHASTNRARRCLTSQIGREGVCSAWCGPSPSRPPDPINKSRKKKSSV